MEKSSERKCDPDGKEGREESREAKHMKKLPGEHCSIDVLPFSVKQSACDDIDHTWLLGGKSTRKVITRSSIEELASAGS